MKVDLAESGYKKNWRGTGWRRHNGGSGLAYKTPS